MKEEPKDERLARLDRNEVGFFDSVYGSQAYNLTGNRLKSERELASLLRAAPRGR